MSHERGVRAQDHMRDGVEKAIERLGTGFISHPGNGALMREATVERADLVNLATTIEDDDPTTLRRLFVATFLGYR